MGSKDQDKAKCAAALKQLSDGGRLELRGSRGQIAGLLAGCLAALAGLLPMEFGFFGDARITPFVAWLSIAVLAWATPALVLRLIRAKDPLIVIDRNGLQDRRTFRGIIPWSEVRGLGASKVERHTYFTIRVAPSFRKEIQWRPVTRFFERLRFGGPKDLVQLGLFGVQTELFTVLSASFAAAAGAGIILEPLDPALAHTKAAPTKAA